jgi:GR25 family glycosyltransferase involved in LPS biosynthesis/cephalosporin hydroxylase
MKITEKYFPILKAEITGWMVEEKMRWLEKLYTDHKPKVAVELGVWYGLSAIAQGIIIRELGLDCKLYAVDAYSKESAIEGSNSDENTEWWLGLDFEEAKQSFLASIKKHGLEDIIIPIVSRSVDAVDQIPNIDLCHFDSNHAAEVISKELELYVPKFNPGAHAVFDDYFWIESNEAYVRGARKHKLNKHVVFEIDGQGFAIYRKRGPLTLSDLKPISIRLEGERWDKRMAEANKYFASQGIKDVLWVRGVHAEEFGIKASRPYVRDPQNIETGETVKQKTVGSYISHYMIYNIALSHPEWEYIFIVEDDCRFVEGWKEKLEQDLKDVPEDFDWLFVGSCCTEGRETTHIKGDIYEVKYPLCGHCSIISRKALKHIIETTCRADWPLDVSLFDFTFDKLKVYTILPRLAIQANTPLPL